MPTSHAVCVTAIECGAKMAMRKRQAIMPFSIMRYEICIAGILEWRRSTIPSQKEICMRSVLLILLLSISVSAQTPAEEVKTIQEDVRVKAAFEHIDKDRDAILREWIAITEINAPSKHEQERARYIESLLRKHKLDIRYDAAGNLIATRKGTGGGPVAVFDAHMDTVFQPGLKIKATVREDRKSTRLNSSHSQISYAVFCLKKKK